MTISWNKNERTGLNWPIQCLTMVFISMSLSSNCKIESENKIDIEPDAGVEKDLGRDLSDLGNKCFLSGDAGLCPGRYEIVFGEKCTTDSRCNCQGITTSLCSGGSGSNLLCKCYKGFWLCMNFRCPSYCPGSYSEAQKSPSCSFTKAQLLISKGTCYYKEGLCHCSNGKIQCF